MCNNLPEPTKPSQNLAINIQAFSELDRTKFLKLRSLKQYDKTKLKADKHLLLHIMLYLLN